MNSYHNLIPTWFREFKIRLFSKFLFSRKKFKATRLKDNITFVRTAAQISGQSKSVHSHFLSDFPMSSSCYENVDGGWTVQDHGSVRGGPDCPFLAKNVIVYEFLLFMWCPPQRKILQKNFNPLAPSYSLTSRYLLPISIESRWNFSFVIYRTKNLHFLFSQEINRILPISYVSVFWQPKVQFWKKRQDLKLTQGPYSGSNRRMKCWTSHFRKKWNLISENESK